MPVNLTVSGSSGFGDAIDLILQLCDRRKRILDRPKRHRVVSALDLPVNAIRPFCRPTRFEYIQIKIILNWPVSVSARLLASLQADSLPE